MQKKKQSKKRWAWTKAQLRKRGLYKSFSYWYVPPKDFRASYHRANRAFEKAMLNKIMNGYIDEDSYIGTKHHPSSAKWDWT